MAAPGSAARRYGYAATSGYRTDGDAGLMHVGARYYDPQVGRFTSRDTVLDQHPYLYCEHEPVNAVDPSGHRPTHRFWAWLGVALVCIAEAGAAAIAVVGIAAGTVTAPVWAPIAVAVVAITGTIMWAYNTDPGGPFFTDPGRSSPPPVGAGPPAGQVYRGGVSIQL